MMHCSPQVPGKNHPHMAQEMETAGHRAPVAWQVVFGRLFRSSTEVTGVNACLSSSRAEEVGQWKS